MNLYSITDCFWSLVLLSAILHLLKITVSDYLRVLTAFISFYYLPTDPWSASFWYLLSGLLDAIDGHLARMLDQGIMYFIIIYIHLQWICI